MLRWCRTLPTFRESRSSWRDTQVFFFTIQYIMTRAVLVQSLGAVFNTHHCHVVQHAAIHPTFIKLGFVLREANIIQPSLVDKKIK